MDSTDKYRASVNTLFSLMLCCVLRMKSFPNHYQSGAHTSSENLKDTRFNPGFQLLLPRKVPLFIMSVQTSGPKIAVTTTRAQLRLEADYIN